MTLPMPTGPVIPGPVPHPVGPVPRVRQARWWDILLTVLFVLGSFVFGAWGGVLGLLGLAFMDTCPPEGCNGDPIYLRFLGAIVLGLVALIVSMVLLALRRRAWWVALIGMLGVFLIWSDFIIGTIAYSLK